MGKFSNAALRLTAGALILDAGVKKLKADEGTYAFLQQMAATGVPAVAKLDAATFGKLISGAETALGATLLAPFIPSRLAGAGLTATPTCTTSTSAPPRTASSSQTTS